MLELLLQSLKHLKNFDKFKQQFAAFFEESKKAGIDYTSVDETEISPFYTRLLPLFNFTDAEDAFEALVLIKKYLLEVPSEIKSSAETTAVKLRAAIRLLDSCPIDSYLFLAFSKEEHKKDNCDSRTIDLSELIKDSIESKENGLDSFSKPLQQQLVQNNICVDKGGFVFRFKQKIEEEKDSPFGNKMGSLMNDIDYSFLKRYGFIISHLKANSLNIIHLLAATIGSKAPHALIHHAVLLRHAEFIRKLPTAIIVEHYKIINLCLQNQGFIETILKEKLFCQFIRSLEKSILIEIILPQELFFLMLYELNSAPSEFENTWTEERNLLALMHQFANSQFKIFLIHPLLRNQIKQLEKESIVEKLLVLMTNMPGRFNQKDIIQFAKEFLPEPQFIRQIYQMFSNTPEKQLAFLQTLPLEEANFFLNKFQQYYAPIFKKILFNGSMMLEKTEIMQAYMQEMKFSPTSIHRLNYENTELKIDRTSILEAIWQKTYSTSTLSAEGLQWLELYKNKHLKTIPETKELKGKLGVPNERIVAFNLLKNALSEETNPHWIHFWDLIRTPEFKTLSGCSSQKAFLPLTRYNLSEIIEKMKERIKQQEQFFSQFKDDVLLKEIMSKGEYFHLLTTNELSLIFKYCNQAFFIELLVKHNRIIDHHPTLTVKKTEHEYQIIDGTQFLTMTDTRETKFDRANQLRTYYGIPQTIPADYRPADLSQHMDPLTPELRYQFTTEDMNVAESILMERYTRLLRNKIAYTPEVKESKSELCFYFIPSSFMPIALPPKHLRTYGFVFSLKLKELVNNSKREEKPVIFCGNLNVRAKHWVAYWIYKNKKGQIFIKWLDPSPQHREWSNHVKKEDRCLKYNADLALQEYFKRLFPTCELGDPVNITQQIRQFDCAPNSLTNHEDVFVSAETATPIIEINDKDELVFHANRLSVNFNYRRCYDFVKKLWLYSPSVEQITRLNRRKWHNLLERATEEKTYQVFSKDQITMDETFHPITQPYDHAANIKRQLSEDKRSDEYSKLTACLIHLGDTINVYKNKFIKTLEFPDEMEIENCITMIHRSGQIDVIIETEIAGEDPRLLIRAILLKNIRDDYVSAITHYIPQFFAGMKIEDTHETKSTLFEKFTHSKISICFGSLNDREKIAVKQQFDDFYQQQNIQQQIQSLHQHQFSDALFVDSIINYLKTTVIAAIDEKTILNHLIQAMASHPQFNASIDFYSKEHPNELRIKIQSLLDAALKPHLHAILEYLKDCWDKTSLSQLASFMTEPKISLLSRVCLDLLNDQTIQSKIPALTITGTRELNLFAQLVAIKIAESLQHQFRKMVHNKLLPETNELLAEEKLISTLKIEQLYEVLNNDDFAHAIANRLHLSNEIKPYEDDSKHFYSLAKTEIIEILRNKIKQKITQDFMPRYLLLMKQSNQLSKEAFKFIFSNVENPKFYLCDFMISNLPNETKKLFNELSWNGTAMRLFEATFGEKVKESFVKIKKEMTPALSFIEALENLSKKCPQIEEFKLVCKTLHKIQNYLWLITTKFPDGLHADFEPILKKEMENISRNMVQSLMQHYSWGDTKTDGYTIQARFLLCHLLHIKTERYLSNEAAILTDLQIQTKLKEPLKLSDHFVFPVMPLYVKAVPVEPITYGKPMTMRLLVQLAANWCISYGAQGSKPYPSKGLAGLYALINQYLDTGNIDLVLTMDSCREKFNSILTKQEVQAEIQRDKIAASFCFALANCAQLSPTVEQKVSQNETNVMMSHVENLLALYKNQPIDDQLLQMHDPFMQNQIGDESKEWKSICKAGFFSRQKSNDSIKKLETCLSQIRRRHQTSENFALNKKDIEDLTALLTNRYQYLVSKNKSNRPNNYFMVQEATDAIFMLLALEMKLAWKNLQVENTAFHLLMPHPTEIFKPHEIKDEAGFSFTYIPDDFTFKELILFPNGRWFPALPFIQKYFTTQLLQHPYTKEMLSDEEVTFIIKNHPIIAEKLLPGLLPKVGVSVIGFPEIKNALCRFLREGVFPSGVGGYYSSSENELSKKAQVELFRFLTTLEPKMREQFDNTLMPPHYNQTLAAFFNRSNDTCVTGFGYGIVKILWRNCPELTLNDMGPGAIALTYEHSEDFNSIKRIVELKPDAKDHLMPNEKPLFDLYCSKISRNKTFALF